MGPRKLSARAYAQHRAALELPGTSHVAVLKAIKSGRLEGAFERRGRRLLIDPDLADVAWAQNTDALEGEKSRPQAGRAKGGRPKRKRTPEPAAPPKPAGAALDSPAEPPPVQFPDAPEAGDLGETGALFGRDALPEEVLESSPTEEGKGLSKALANASKTAWQADLVRLQVLERQGVLVRATEVEAETTRIFRALRKQLEAIPKRIDANLAASSERLECRRMVEQEIALALSAVSAKCSGGTPERAAG